MDNGQAMQVLDVIQKKSDELFEELRVQLTDEAPSTDSGGSVKGETQSWTLSSEAPNREENA